MLDLKVMNTVTKYTVLNNRLVLGAAGEKNMHDAEFTCLLFRFIQLTCEGHNLGNPPVYSSIILNLHDDLFLYRMAELLTYSSW